MLSKIKILSITTFSNLNFGIKDQDILFYSIKKINYHGVVMKLNGDNLLILKLKFQQMQSDMRIHMDELSLRVY
jgi:hypothetical protein